MTQSPTKEQQDIIAYEPLSLEIIAPAGCGKTESLALRAQGLLARYDFSDNARKLLVVTFTNNARDNISERLSRYIPSSIVRRHVCLTNFHGLSGRIIQAHGNIIGLNGSWIFPRYDWVGRWCRIHQQNYQETYKIKSALQQAKLNYLSDSEVMDELHVIGNRQAILLEEERISEHQLTYDDLVRLALLILNNQDVAHLYSNHFFAALVDEFQDLTPQQLNLINKICYRRTTYAGDVSQGIFSFAGANPQVISAAIGDECSRKVPLSESWRSSPAVLEAINSLDRLTGGQELTAARPGDWPGGGLFGCAGFEDRQQEATWVTDVCGLISSNCPNQRIGIIARTRFRRNEIENELENRGYRISKWEDGLFDKAIGRFLMDACQAVSDYRFSDFEEKKGFIADMVSRMSNSEGTSDELFDAAGWLLDLLAEGVPPSEIEKRIHIRTAGDHITNAPGIHGLTGHAGKGQQFDWVIVPGAEEGSIPDYRADTESKIAEEVSSNPWRYQVSDEPGTASNP